MEHCHLRCCHRHDYRGHCHHHCHHPLCRPQSPSPVPGAGPSQTALALLPSRSPFPSWLQDSCVAWEAVDVLSQTLRPLEASGSCSPRSLGADWKGRRTDPFSYPSLGSPASLTPNFPKPGQSSQPFVCARGTRELVKTFACGLPAVGRAWSPRLRPCLCCLVQPGWLNEAFLLPNLSADTPR